MSVTEKLFGSTKSYFKRNAGIMIGLVALCVVIAFRSDSFLTYENIMNVLRQSAQNIFIASGMTIILIAGGIDLSVGSVVGLVGVMVGTMVNDGMPILLAVGICLVVGALMGTFNGMILSRTTLPPFIVTYALMTILRGGIYVYTGGTTVRIDDRSFIAVGTGYTLGIPNPVWYMAVILAIVYLILNRTKLGRHIYAIGGNEKAAEFSGIDVKNVRLFVYVFSGIMAAVAGIVLAARSYSGQPTAGTGAEMDAIEACVLGGCSMAGGYGFIGGTIIGALIIAIMNNGLNLMRIDSYWQMVAKGVIVLIAVYVDYVKNQKKNQKG
ncbi:MAG: ribose ABC transporter permease [Subdoligranulum sp.]|nr:ribose ABC transporter permease [Subdoligranulum sp.]